MPRDDSSLREVFLFFFFPRKSTIESEVVFTLLMKTRFLDSSSDISFSANLCVTFTQVELLSSSLYFSFKSRNTTNLAECVEMFLLKSQSDGFYSFWVLSLTTFILSTLKMKDTK